MRRSKRKNEREERHLRRSVWLTRRMHAVKRDPSWCGCDPEELAREGWHSKSACPQAPWNEEGPATTWDDATGHEIHVRDAITLACGHCKSPRVIAKDTAHEASFDCYDCLGRNTVYRDGTTLILVPCTERTCAACGTNEAAEREAEEEAWRHDAERFDG